MKKSIGGILLVSLMSLTFLSGASSIKEPASAKSEEVVEAQRFKIREEKNCVISTLVEEIKSGKVYTFKIGGEDVGQFRLTKYRSGWAIMKGTLFVGVRNDKIVYKVTPTEWKYEDGAFSAPVIKFHFGFINIDTSNEPTKYIKSFKIGAKLSTEKTVVEIYNVVHTTHALTEWTDCGDGINHKKECLNGCGYEEYGFHDFGEFNSSLTCLDCGAENPGDPEISVCATFSEKQYFKLSNLFLGKPLKVTKYFADVEVGYFNVGVSKVELRMNETGDFVEGYHCSLNSRIKTLEVRVTDTRHNVYNKVIKNFTVSFDLQGQGGKVAPITHVDEGTLIQAPARPAARGERVFAGWYKEAECLNPWNFEEDKVLGDTVLYAKWVEGFTLDNILGLSYDVFPYATSVLPNPTNPWVNAKGAIAFKKGNDLVLTKESNKLTLPLNTEFVLNENDEYIYNDGAVTWKFTLVNYYGFGYLGYFEVDGSEGFDGAYAKSSNLINFILMNTVSADGFPVGATRPENAWSNEKGARLYLDKETKKLVIVTPEKETIVLENNSPLCVYDKYLIRDDKNNIKLMFNYEDSKLAYIEASSLNGLSASDAEFGTFVPAYDLGRLINTVQNGFPTTEVGKAPLDAWKNENGAMIYTNTKGQFVIEDVSGACYIESLEKPFIYEDGYYVNSEKTSVASEKIKFEEGNLVSIEIKGNFGNASGIYRPYAATVLNVLESLKVALPYFNGEAELWRNGSGAGVSYDKNSKSIVFNTFSLPETSTVKKVGENYVCNYRKGFDYAKVTFVMSNGSLSSIIVSDASLLLRRANGEYVPTHTIESIKDVLATSDRRFPVRAKEDANNPNVIPEEAWRNENNTYCFIQNNEDGTQSLVFCEILEIQEGYKIEKKITVENILDKVDLVEGNYVYSYLTFKISKGMLSSIEVNYPRGSLYVSFNGAYEPII